jgi:hypothetical protein
MRILQKFIILLNFRPFTKLFHVVYGMGLKLLLSRLKKHPAIHCVFGCGSFFGGKCLYGVSDIDLIIVIDEAFTRYSTQTVKIAHTYNRVRRFFPFLGNWSEKAENLIFLSDAALGFPIPDSFRLRYKRGRFCALYGKPFPGELIAGSDCVNEAISEINTLMRMVLTRGDINTSNLLFWKKIFSKLADLAGVIGCPDVETEILGHDRLDFLEKGDIPLYIQKSNPALLFSLLLEMTGKIFKKIEEKEERVTLNIAVGTDGIPPRGEPVAPSAEMETKVLKDLCRSDDISVEFISTPLFGITPRFNYFPMEASVAVVDIRQNVFHHLSAMIQTLSTDKKVSLSFMVRFKSCLAIISKNQEYVDVVFLDPIVFKNVHMKISGKTGEVKMPAAVYEHQKRVTENMFRALARLYQKNEGHVTKFPFPCVYSEDDLVVINDAFHRMRVHVLHLFGRDIPAPGALMEFLSGKFPGCLEFLTDLLEYQRGLTRKDAGPQHANNLYRCLHQFMAQLLSGAPQMVIDAHRKRLGITVGVITRNRASDLKDLLESLTRQTRMADEVLIVDNGSTDGTRAAAASFKDALPINYRFLKEASIPTARNMVIEHAENDIVSFTDDDCIAAPDWLAAVERGFLRADNIGMVGGWVEHEPSTVPSIIDTYYSLFHHNTT